MRVNKLRIVNNVEKYRFLCNYKKLYINNINYNLNIYRVKTILFKRTTRFILYLVNNFI